MVNKRVLSGIQPTGNLHLGNYLGAMKNFVDMQNEYECFYMLADLHAITVKVDPSSLKENIINTAAAFLASGIDPKKNVIFSQSSVSAHSELSWILNCVARVGWLNRMTQFKEKAGSNKENASVGLFTYPVLMAADILLYKATHVPVGEDQKQHLELCRDIASKFNREYNLENFFNLPEPIIPKKTARIMSLKDGQKKMSKSEASDLSRINLTDTKDQIEEKIRKAKTDSDPIDFGILDSNSKRFEAKNLISIFSSLNNSSEQDTIKEFDGKSFSEFKKKLTDILVENITPIGKKIFELKKEKEQLVQILKNGQERANKVAGKTLHEVKSIVGLI